MLATAASQLLLISEQVACQTQAVIPKLAAIMIVVATLCSSLSFQAASLLAAQRRIRGLLSALPKSM